MNTCQHPGGCRRRVMSAQRNPSQLCEVHRPRPRYEPKPRTPEQREEANARLRRKNALSGMPVGWNP